MPSVRFTPRAEPLDDRTVPAAAAWPTEIGQAVAADDGGPPTVHLFDKWGGAGATFDAYDPAFRGGVRTAVGDVTGDGVPDVVTAAGPGGGPHVKVFDGKTGGQLWRGFYAYAPTFTGGVEVAVADVNRDGYDDIITGAGAGGGPHVRVFDGKTGAVLTEFFAYSQTFTGGVYVAGGDLNRDGYADIVTGAGAGGGPHVKAFDGRTWAVLTEFFAYDPTFSGGARVASGDLNGDGVDDIITAAGPGGGPHVKAFDARTGQMLFSQFAADPTFAGGVRPTTTTLPYTYDAREAVVARTRTGDVTTSAIYQSNTSTSGLSQKVWVGDGQPPPGVVPSVVFPPLASGVLPVRVLEGRVTGVAADGKSMTIARGDGSTVTLDLAGDPVLPDGAIYIEGSISPATFFLGDQTAALADIRPGRWVRAKVGRAFTLSQPQYMAVEVHLL